VQDLQAYFRRTVTMTRSCAGIDEDQQTVWETVCLRRVQPLCSILADLVLEAAAARAIEAVNRSEFAGDHQLK